MILESGAVLLIIKMVGREPSRDVHRINMPDMAICEIYADIVNRNPDRIEMALCLNKNLK